MLINYNKVIQIVYYYSDTNHIFDRYVCKHFIITLAFFSYFKSDYWVLNKQMQKINVIDSNKFFGIECHVGTWPKPNLVAIRGLKIQKIVE